jgi:hypothetical protein
VALRCVLNSTSDPEDINMMIQPCEWNGANNRVLNSLAVFAIENRHLGREHPLILPDLPVVRTLYLTENQTIEPPSPRLLALHRAIANILHFSVVGDYINTILRDMEWKDTRADGSTELGRLVTLGLGGWSGVIHSWLERPGLDQRHSRQMCNEQELSQALGDSCGIWVFTPSKKSSRTGVMGSRAVTEIWS